MLRQITFSVKNIYFPRQKNKWNECVLHFGDLLNPWQNRGQYFPIYLCIQFVVI